ncbi:MAG: TonB-dependent receptor [Burkholderiales bacterium]|nr:TonB-dependent receptor [Burkholderiales bacterium]
MKSLSTHDAWLDPIGMITRQPATWMALAALTAPISVWAQDSSIGGQAETTTAPQPSVIQRVEIVGRQGSTELRRAASVAKQIYGREELDRFGDTNVLDVMRRLPGVNVSSGGPRMRGLGAGYTQILINGDPAPQGFNLDQLSPSQIERIEVLRAPTADQSAQAVAGTINIILKEAPRSSQKSLRLGLVNGRDRPMANMNYSISESKGPFNMSLPVSLFEWDRQVRTNIDRQMEGTDGKPAVSEQIGTGTSWGWGYNIAPRFNFKFSDEQTLSVATFFQKGFWNFRTDYLNRAISGSPVFDDNSLQDGYWENRRGNLTWVNRFSPDQRIEIKAGFQQGRSAFDSRNLRSGALQLNTVGSNQDDAITQSGKYSHLLGNSHSLTAGWDLENRDRLERRTTTDAAGNALLPSFEGQPFEAQVRRQAFYIQDEWEISPQWQLYLGLRNERIISESATTASPVRNESSVLSPLAHVTYKFNPKSRDMIRASLTRSYKAPGLNTLLARPQINGAFTNTNLTNTPLAPDRMGNPALTPELATGLDIAYENYLSNDGIFSVGIFHRNLTNVVRNVTELRTVSWANAPRWISQPQNFSDAVTSGLEFELRGRASDLMPTLLGTAKALNIRTSLSIYNSSIAALNGPNNRLDGQQPWSANFGFDQRIAGLPLSVGGNLSYTPGYETRQTVDQLVKRSSARSIDLFAMMFLSPTMSFRAAASAGVQQFGPPNGTNFTQYANGDYVRSDRYAKPQLNLSLDMRL